MRFPIFCCYSTKKNTVIPPTPINITRPNHPPPPPHTPYPSTITRVFLHDKLKDIDYKDTKTFYHKITYCKCVKVYDGDTITIATILSTTEPYLVNRFSVRIMGIDAPEIKGGSDNEKALAVISREALRKKILGKMIRLEIIEEPEKWGRILAKVYLDDEDICKYMLDNNYAVPYSGGTKNKPNEWM